MLVADSGTAALDLLLKHEVALAILDVNMPGMNGFELAALMRGSPRTSHVPIIFLTATAQDASRTFRGYEAGAVDFLYKPFDPRILQSKVDVFVQLEQQKRQLAAQLVDHAADARSQRDADGGAESRFAHAAWRGAGVGGISDARRRAGRTVGDGRRAR